MVLGQRAPFSGLPLRPLLLGEADVGEQAGQQAGEDLGHRAAAGGVEVQLARGLLQLGDQILPFAEAHEVEVLGPAHAAERASAEFATLRPQVGPDVEQHLEVAALEGDLLLALVPRPGVGGVSLRLVRRVGRLRLIFRHPAPESAVQLVGLGLELGGAFPHVRDGEAGDEDEHRREAVAARALDQHPPELRVDRHPCQHPAGPGQPEPVVALSGMDRAELAEHPDAVVDVRDDRCLDEREGLHVAEAGLRHQQDDGGEVGAQDLRVGELRPGVEVLLREQADGHAGTDAPTPSGALIGRRLGDGLDRQALHLCA